MPKNKSDKKKQPKKDDRPSLGWGLAESAAQKIEAHKKRNREARKKAFNN